MLMNMCQEERFSSLSTVVTRLIREKEVEEEEEEGKRKDKKWIEIWHT